MDNIWELDFRVLAGLAVPLLWVLGSLAEAFNKGRESRREKEEARRAERDAQSRPQSLPPRPTLPQRPTAPQRPTHQSPTGDRRPRPVDREGRPARPARPVPTARREEARPVPAPPQARRPQDAARRSPVPPPPSPAPRRREAEVARARAAEQSQLEAERRQRAAEVRETHAREGREEAARQMANRGKSLHAAPSASKPQSRRRSLTMVEKVDRVLQSRSGFAGAFLMSEVIGPPVALRKNHLKPHDEQ